MLWFTILIEVRFIFVTSVASQTTLEIIVLALTTNPATIGKLKVFLNARISALVKKTNFAAYRNFLDFRRFFLDTLFLAIVPALFSIFLFLLVLAPFGATCVKWILLRFA